MNTLPLRFPKFWLILGWIFVALAIMVCLLPAGTPGLELTNDKVEHAGGYIALTLWFSGLYPRKRYWLIALALTLMGIGIEFLQSWMALGRHGDSVDVVADVAGIAIGIALARLFFGGWMQRMERLLVRV